MRQTGSREIDRFRRRKPTALLALDDSAVGACSYRSHPPDNLLVALREAGANPQPVVKTTVYVVGEQATLVTVWDVVRTSRIGAARPASTLLGVEQLGYRGQLVEVEAVAVLT